MAISSAVCTSFKSELFTANHNFTLTSGSAFYVALFNSSATLSAATTAYTGTIGTTPMANEVTGTGYTAGGRSLTNVTPVISGTTAIVDFQDTSWTSSTITARGCMIYNSSSSNRSVLVQDFGADYVTASGTFTLVFPIPDASNAIIRLA